MTTRVFTRRPQHDIVTSTQHLLGDASPGSPQPSWASICELVGSYDIHLDVWVPVPPAWCPTSTGQMNTNILHKSYRSTRKTVKADYPRQNRGKWWFTWFRLIKGIQADIGLKYGLIQEKCGKEGNANSSSLSLDPDREAESTSAVPIPIEATYGRSIGDPYKPLFPVFQALCGPSHSGLGHVTCLGQWDISKCDTSRAHKLFWKPSCLTVRNFKPSW